MAQSAETARQYFRQVFARFRPAPAQELRLNVQIVLASNGPQSDAPLKVVVQNRCSPPARLVRLELAVEGTEKVISQVRTDSEPALPCTLGHHAILVWTLELEEVHRLLASVGLHEALVTAIAIDSAGVEHRGHAVRLPRVFEHVTR